MGFRHRAAWVALALSVIAAPLRAEPDPGAYLAARQALIAGDFDAAARYLLTAIDADSANPDLIESAIAAQVGRGAVADAAPLALMMRDLGARSQLSAMVALAARAGAADWTGLIADLDGGPDGSLSVSPLADALIRAWALVGTGDMQAALAAFDSAIAAPGMRPFGLYHKALALAFVGDFEGADAILSLPPDQGLRPSRRSVIAHAQVLAQLGRGPEALDLIDSAFPGTIEPALAALRAELAAGGSPAFTLVRSPATGLAETFYTVAGAILDEADDSTVLFHARIAQALDPGHVDALFLTAQILERMDQLALARAAYALVPADDPAFPLAELGRAEVLRHEGQTAAAIEVLTALTRAHPDLAAAQSRLADFLRLDGRLADSLPVYDAALGLIPADDSGRWRVLYSRGVAHFGLDDWPAASADFDAALELAPGHPSVLNFYGYSLVERGERLDEALAMIERAIDADPDNGAIVDSLGWALYTLGRYPEAVMHLERAAALEPGDAVINDHLGDAYWQVGREREARFQWRRALSFEPAPEDAARIRDKLSHGLATPAAQDAAALGTGGTQSGG